jgi:release factor glutamine methyltransferase
VNRLKELRDRMIRDLSAIFPEKESENLVYYLLDAVAGIERKDISLDPDRPVGEELNDLLQIKLSELKEHKPVQYVTGKAYFYGLGLEVNPSVLIPRPETEELVKWVVDDHQDDRGLKVLDIGTGSGCIILALGQFLNNPRLTAIDISEDALETASHNAERLGIPVGFRSFDILDEAEWENLGTFDVVVSNPPYVRESEKLQMQPNVLNYEPPGALFVPDDDPLIFYRAIARIAKSRLIEGGELYLEINENLGEEVIQLLEDEGFTGIFLKKDMQGKDRMVRCRLPFINHNSHNRTQ